MRDSLRKNIFLGILTGTVLLSYVASTYFSERDYLQKENLSSSEIRKKVKEFREGFLRVNEESSYYKNILESKDN